MILQLPPLIGLLIISIIIALIINLAYKFMTDQKLMKEIREKMKEHQKNMKNNKEPEKILQANKELMDLNAKYFMHSLKPTIITMIPILIIIGWLSAHYSYLPILPEKEFTTTIIFNEDINGNVTIKQQEGIEIIGNNIKEINDGKAEFTLKGSSGEYLLEFEHNGKSYTKRVVITKKQEYEKPITTITGNAMKEIRINNEINKPLKIPVINWQIGWLGTYIIFSIVANLIIRKAMRLY